MNFYPPVAMMAATRRQSGGAHAHGGGAGGEGGRLGIDPLGLIDSCTAESLAGQPDWTINMQIVDYLTQVPSDTPVILDALRKKIMSKKHSVGLLSVLLVETIVKNVPASHPYVAQREFMETVLIKSLPRSIRKPNEGPSLNSLMNEPSDIKSPLAIQRWECILRCIAQWSGAFDSAQYPIFKEVHRMLERRGVRFPAVDREENAPVFLAEKPRPPRPQASAPPLSAEHQQAAPSHATQSAAHADTDIKASLETVQIFRDMIQNSEPGYPLTEDELIQQLYSTCRSNAGILSSRLTRAANGAVVDEDTMMRLISAHEAIQEVIKFYEDVISGVRRPNGGENESKEDDESHAQRQSRRPQPDASSSSSSSSGQSSMPDPFAPPAAAPKPSDLPLDLTQFDMLGLSPPPPAAVPAHQAQSTPQRPVAQAPVQDPFAAFPIPISSPVHAPPAAAAASTSSPQVPASSAKKHSITSPAAGLIAPPPSSTRHRKDSTARRAEAAAAAAPATLTNGSPKMTAAPTQPVQKDSLLDFDLLLASDSAAAGGAAAAGAQPSLFAAAVAPPPVNVFDSFNVAPQSAAGSSAHRMVNPFDSFGEDAPPTGSAFDNDPFASIATRTPNPSAAGTQQQNAFGF